MKQTRKVILWVALSLLSVVLVGCNQSSTEKGKFDMTGFVQEINKTEGYQNQILVDEETHGLVWVTLKNQKGDDFEIGQLVALWIEGEILESYPAQATARHVEIIGESNAKEVGLKAETESDDGQFVYRLVSEHDIFQKNGMISMYAELEYIGNENEITIYHAASPFYFPMSERTRGIEISYPMEQPLIQTVLKKGEPLRATYSASGGYSEGDSKTFKQFMQSIMEEKFPAGEYEVQGYTDFFIVNEDDVEQDYKIHGEIQFKVE